MWKGRFSFGRTGAIMQKEFTQLRRERSTFAMIVLLPIIQLLLFGYAVDTNPKNLPTYILSRDQSVFSRSFVAGLKNSLYFDIRGDVHSDEEGEELLRKGQAQFIVTIPEHFERDLVGGKRPALLVQVDGTDPVASSGPAAAMNGILESVSKHDLKGPLEHLNTGKPAVELIQHRMYNPEGLTRFNIVPGLLGIILTMTGVMMVALALTRERERGTMENLLAMPARPLEVMIGKIVPYIFIGYIQSTIVVTAARVLFSVPVLGSLWLLGGVLGIFITCNMAMGYALATISRTQMQAMQGTILITLPSLMLSGFIFPFLGMPGWAQTIGHMIPMTYFNRIVRGIMLKGNGIQEIWPETWPLLIFLLVATIIAIKCYRKTID
jgi:ABC-2 type transport system permease protein